MNQIAAKHSISAWTIGTRISLPELRGLGVLAISLVALLPPLAQGATFNISNGDVAGLITAMNTANGNGQSNTINLAMGGTYILTAVDNTGYYGPTGLPIINSPMTFNGNGATIQRSIAPGTPDFRIFLISNGPSQLTLNAVAILGGRGSGGGLLNTGVALLTNSTVSENGGGEGGGIFNYCGKLTVQNSTISHNTGFGGLTGGGILNFSSYCQATTTIINSTIFENRADGPSGFQGRGDAIADSFSPPGSIIVKNSILASPSRGLGNTCNVATGVMVSLGHNIAGDASCGLSGAGDLNSTNPLLGPLANNGLPTATHTQTHAPLLASPAIDAVPLADCTDTNGAPIATDQRGVPRPQGLACDIGSVEIQSTGQFTEYPLPAIPGSPRGITTGPDGALWFTELFGNKIGRITTTGVITEHSIPTPGSIPQVITSGPDGALWFTEGYVNKIGRITTAGAITEYPSTVDSFPWGITTGPDGALWFTDTQAKIGRITTAGAITAYLVPTLGDQRGIAVGPDGALWFTERSYDKIGRITTAGAITEYALPGSNPLALTGKNPFGISAGTDGALWFTETFGNKIGRITTGGTINEYLIPTPNSGPSNITAGPDGALWFTEGPGNKIGRITTVGAITEFLVPTPASLPSGITTGPDGALWFTEINGEKIGRINPPDTIPPDTTIYSAVDGNGAAVANGGTTLSSSIAFSFVGSDNVGVADIQCKLDVGAFASCPTPVSYSAVSIGSHIFEVRALDVTGNIDSSPASFTWTVVTPIQAIQNLINTINFMGLPGGVANSLSATLKNIDPNNLASACNKLDAFINKLGVKLQNGDLTQVQANQLLQAGKAIKASLGCP